MSDNLHFGRVRLLAGPVGAPESELVEVGEVIAHDIAPNVTGGSLTVHGVEPEQFAKTLGDLRAISWDSPAMATSMEDFNRAVQELSKTMATAFRVPSSVWGRASDDRWLISRAMRDKLCQSRSVLHGQTALRKLNSIQSSRRSPIRLVSQTTLPGTSLRQAEKRQRRRTRRMADWSLSWQKQSSRH